MANEKIILSLLAISTISSADSVTLKCSFPGYRDGTITINQSFRTFNYSGPGSCSSARPAIAITDNMIWINADNCSIDISRATGDVKVSNYGNGAAHYKGTCTKQSNAI